MQLPLLVSVLALLTNQTNVVSTLPRRFDFNLNRVIDLIEKVDETVAKKHFVRDVQNLYDAGCQDDFFCKAHQVLNQREAFGKIKGLQEIAMNLEKYVNGTKVDCPLLLKKEKPSGDSRPLHNVLKLLKACVQRRNFNRQPFMKPNDRNATS